MSPGFLWTLEDTVGLFDHDAMRDMWSSRFESLRPRLSRSKCETVKLVKDFGGGIHAGTTAEIEQGSHDSNTRVNIYCSQSCVHRLGN